MGNKRKLSVAIAIIAAIALTIVIGSIIAIGSGTNAPQDRQLYMAQMYAERFGTTVDEARFRLNVPFLLPDLQSTLSNKEPGTFGGAWVQNEPEFKVVVAFTHDGTATMGKYWQYIPGEVARYVEVRTVQKSLNQLLDEQRQVSLACLEVGLQTDLGLDIVNNRVKINVRRSDQAKLEDYTRNKILILPENARVNWVSELIQPDVNVYGGLSQNGGTAGFSVIDGSGTKGIATAGHIDDNLSVQDPDGNWVSGTFQSEAWVGCYDCQWYVPAPTATPVNRIKWWSDGSTLNITSTTSRGSMWVGQTVSKYGKTTNYTCGTIDDLYFEPYGSVPYAMPTFVEVYNAYGYTKIADFGDSGGPWFSGNTAFGIHHGHNDDGTQTAVFMSVEFLPGGIGVNVLTQ